jgi:hypothetical protein
MSWLVVGIAYGVLFQDNEWFTEHFNLAIIDAFMVYFSSRRGFDESIWRKRPDMSDLVIRIFMVMCFLGTPAVGGMVVDAQMIREFGVCVLLPH